MTTAPQFNEYLQKWLPVSLHWREVSVIFSWRGLRSGTGGLHAGFVVAYQGVDCRDLAAVFLDLALQMLEGLFGPSQLPDALLSKSREFLMHLFHPLPLLGDN